ncbi:hypothetical protein [Orrella sp. 11846]|uniref:hypothetical protein n=1 Tax=Orrella sp. 11846 TaxID=3409913 RepID=UPI003B5C2449
MFDIDTRFLKSQQRALQFSAPHYQIPALQRKSESNDFWVELPKNPEDPVSIIPGTNTAPESSVSVADVLMMVAIGLLLVAIVVVVLT